MPRPLVSRRRFWTWQRLLLLVLVLAFALSFWALARLFYMQNTVLVPTTGGTYIEGSVGDAQPLNPWFTVTNDVNRDIASLVFAGLLRYNPETRQIEDDLATMRVSTDGHIYDLTLKDDLWWHDTTDLDPHPVTVEDVLYTFETVQNPDFPNALLHQNFLGVDIEILDERTVRFELEEPYRFFPSNLTLGLVPQRAFEGVPVGRLDQALDFGFNPIGAGPYAFRGLVQTELSTEISLERFSRSLEPKYHLDQIIFRIFPDYPTLLSDLRNLHGVRLVPRNEEGDPLIPRRFKAANYTLPQYVSLFLNLDNSFLQDEKLRLALQLGTNKQAIIESIGESLIVDTPLLEIDVSDWRYQYDPTAAQGALFTSNWNLPEKVRLQRLQEIREANEFGILQIDPVVFLETGAALTVTGSVADLGSTGGTINGLPLSLDATNTGVWIAVLPTVGTGSLEIGYNLVSLISDDGETADSFYVWRTDDPKEYDRASREQRLLELFMQSRAGTIEPENRMMVSELFLEKGHLRQRQGTDPTDIRVNDRGEKLSLRLLTSSTPPQYQEVAYMIKDQWETLGVHVGIDVPETREEFEEKLLSRNYDVILFGQSLLDNLDSYPYWHSSGIQKQTEDRNELVLDAYNLSQYSSLEADQLLEFIRKTPDEAERDESLNELREVLKNDVPAVFLYSPLYTFAYHQDVRGIELGDLSLHSDRFLTLHHWYVQEDRVFNAGVSWWSFPRWLVSLI